MKVLDIHPTRCWSLHGRNERVIAQLRAAVAIEDTELRDEILRNIPDGKAFGFVGDATKLEFAPRFFDEVNVAFTPDVQQRTQLRQCVRRWCKNRVEIPEPDEDENQEVRWGSLWHKILGRMMPNTAS